MQRGISSYGNLTGTVGARKERKSRALVVMGEGRVGDGFFWYAGMDTCDARVADDPVSEAGWKKMA